MDKTKLVNAGLIGGLAGTVVLGVSAIVAECRRHKARQAQLDAEIMLGLTQIDGVLKDAKIRTLEEELKKNKSE